MRNKTTKKSKTNDLEDPLLFEQDISTLSSNSLLGTSTITPITEDNSIVGTNENDFLIGTNTTDHFFGFEGDDMIIPLLGIAGEVGAISGGLGYDTVYYGNLNTGIEVQSAGINLSVSKGINGAQGEDLILFDSEHIIGTNFDDVFGGSKLDNIYQAGLGNDDMRGGRGNDKLYGNGGDDIIRGGRGDDLIHGNEGNDILKGGKGSDIILGQDGDDTINGGADFDTLIGGLGADTFIFNASALSARDTINDFENGIGGDTIDLSSLLSDYDPLNDLIDNFVTFSSEGASAVISVDQDGAETTYGFEQIVALYNISSSILDIDDMITDGNLMIV